MSDKPCREPPWFPKLCNAEYFAQLRKDYPHKAGWTDKELHEHFDNGAKYSTTWDHTDDDYEALADAYLTLLEQRPAAGPWVPVSKPPVTGMYLVRGVRGWDVGFYDTLFKGWSVKGVCINPTHYAEVYPQKEADDDNTR